MRHEPISRDLPKLTLIATGITFVVNRLRLSPAKVYTLPQSGELECYRIGRSVRVSEEQITQFLAEARHEVTRFSPSTKRHFRTDHAA